MRIFCKKKNVKNTFGAKLIVFSLFGLVFKCECGKTSQSMFPFYDFYDVCVCAFVHLCDKISVIAIFK